MSRVSRMCWAQPVRLVLGCGKIERYQKVYVSCGVISCDHLL